MSPVGLRPERPVFVNEFRKDIPGYMLRHKVKTGITGWAQVNGWRGSTSIEKRIECDLYYIQNWSFWLDLKILIMTIEEVLIEEMPTNFDRRRSKLITEEGSCHIEIIVIIYSFP